jgi:hypothetical protein
MSPSNAAQNTHGDFTSALPVENGVLAATIAGKLASPFLVSHSNLTT